MATKPKQFWWFTTLAWTAKILRLKVWYVWDEPARPDVKWTFIISKPRRNK